MRIFFAVGATLFFAGLQAQILHTVVTPNVITTDTLLLIDLDQDTVPDFAIRTQFNRTENNAVYDVISVTPLGQQGHRVAGTTPTVFPYASRFGLNEFIGPETPFLNPEIEGGMSFVRNGQFLFNDPWNGGATDEFLGFAIRRNDSIHYGWAKVDVGNDGKSVTLKEFAVNLTPGAPINTNRFFTVTENPLRDLVIWQSAGMVHLRLPDNQGRVEVQLTDIQGRVLRSEHFFGAQHSIPLNLPAGVYLLLVKKDHSFITRKIQYSPVWH